MAQKARKPSPKQIKTIEFDQINGTMEKLKAYSQEQSKAMAQKLETITKQLPRRSDNDK